MKKISLTNPPSTAGEISEISSTILGALTPDQLFAADSMAFCYHTLTFFDFQSGDLDPTDQDSIRNGCFRVCQMLGWDTDPFHKELGHVKQEIDFVKHYMQFFLGYEKVPGEILAELSSVVESDLKAINDRIAVYENVSFIQVGERPRNHGEKTIRAFYDRCLEERDAIENYKLNQMRERARTKAAAGNPFGSSIAFFDAYFDHPYKTTYQNSGKLFDHSKIDKVAHRVGSFTIAEAKELKLLYQADKAAFYEKLFDKLPVRDSLKLLAQYVEFLPLVNPQRHTIFKEMEGLYKTKSWFGFYALGLTQVEGLFGDMCQVCNPNFYNPKASLPDKVKIVRDYYPHSETRLDYFEFEVPNQRNAFLHKGTSIRLGDAVQHDIQILCNDLLLDLLECLRIFSVLNVDAIYLNRLLRKPSITEFHSIESFCAYADMVHDVNLKRQYHFFEERINNLNDTVFPDYIFNIAFEINDVFNDAYNEFASFFNEVLKDKLVNSPSLDAITNKELAPISLAGLYIPYDVQRSLDRLMHISQFGYFYERIFKTSRFSKDTLKTLKAFYSSNKMTLKKLSFIADKIKSGK